MKEQNQQRILIFIGLLIIGVGGFFGKLVGDAITEVANLKTFQSVLQLARPIQVSIHHVQRERSVMLGYLHSRSTETENALNEASQQVDEKLKKVSQQLKVTQVRLLAIPESEISEIRKALNFQREYNRKNNTAHPEPVQGHNQVISSLFNYLEKLFEFGNTDEYKSVSALILSLISFQEELLRDQDYIAHIINRDFTLGEMALFKQRFINEEVKLAKLKETENKSLRNEVSPLFDSTEWIAIQNFRRRFDSQEPELKGSPSLSLEYQNLIGEFAKLLTKKELSLSSALWESVQAQKEEMTQEGLQNGAVGLGIILLLIGLYIFLRRITPTK